MAAYPVDPGLNPAVSGSIFDPLLSVTRNDDYVVNKVVPLRNLLRNLARTQKKLSRKGTTTVP